MSNATNFYTTTLISGTKGAVFGLPLTLFLTPFCTT